jgi:glycosyltransferase involved in cell wall biosynthesis
VRLGVVTSCVSRRAGGLFHSVRRLSQTTRDLGEDVSVFSLADDDTPADIGAWLPIVPELAHVVGPHRLGYSPGLSKLIRSFASENALLHQHGIWQFPSADVLRWRRHSGQPTVISPRGMLDPWAVKNSALRKKIVGFLYEYANLRAASCIHALAESEYVGIRQFGLRGPVAVIPNGIDIPSEVELETPLPSDFPSAWHGSRVLLFLGRVHPKKGLVPLLEGWAKLGSIKQDWKLAIAGPDEVGHHAEIALRIDALGLRHEATLVGPQYGIGKKQWLNRADAFVLPSFSEGFPMAVLEAMAHRLPVLMTRECHFPEAFDAGVAYEAKPQADSLAEQLEQLFARSSTDLNEVGVRARQFTAERYSWPIIAREMIDVYRWLLDGGAPPSTVRLD